LSAAAHPAHGRHAAAIARWVETTPDGVATGGFFYGGNIAGAVIGSLDAGFYLLRVSDCHHHVVAVG
jgi:spermidine synthase